MPIAANEIWVLQWSLFVTYPSGIKFKVNWPAGALFGSVSAELQAIGAGDQQSTAAQTAVNGTALTLNVSGTSAISFLTAAVDNTGGAAGTVQLQHGTNGVNGNYVVKAGSSLMAIRQFP